MSAAKFMGATVRPLGWTGPIIACGAFLPVPGLAATIDLDFTIPRVPAMEYHRPYVVIWIEKPDHGGFRTLSIWQDKRKTGDDGKKYLSGLREWWRRGGESLELPADGISGATRAPGAQTLTLSGRQTAGLPPGKYVLVVEAAREVGGQEAVHLPIEIPANGKPAVFTASGVTELGAVQASVKP